MSVYNGEHWLNESIESVLNQTYQDFEFIIVNDGSTDSSMKILSTFAAKDRRIKVIDKPNSGLTDSLNIGISNTSGKWIARIDSDDLCERDRLAKQYDLAKNQKGVVLIGSAAREIDSNNQIIKNHKYPSGHQELVQRLNLPNKSFFPHSSAFMKTKTVQDLGGYRQRLRRAQDYDLWLRISEKGEMRCITSPLVRIRKHSGQISNEDKGQRQLIDSRVALVSHLLRRHGYPDPVEMTNTDLKFGEFWKFIQKRVEKNRLTQSRQFVDEVIILLKDTKTDKKISAFKMVLKNPAFVFRYFRERLFGEKLAEKLCEEWISQNKK